MNRPPATAIGNSFVAAYYNTLNKTPNEVHLYYHTESSLARLSQDAESSDDDIATGVEVCLLPNSQGHTCALFPSRCFLCVFYSLGQ